MSKEALLLWQRRLDHLLVEEARCADPIQKFAIRVETEEAQVRIKELSGASPPGVLLPAVSMRELRREILLLIDLVLRVNGQRPAERVTSLPIRVSVLLEMPGEMWPKQDIDNPSALIAILAWAEKEKKLLELLDVLRDILNSPTTTLRKPKRELVYIGYSHADNGWYQRVRRFLDADPEIRDLIWADREIPSNAVVFEEIAQHVERARIMIMLGSENYFGPRSGATECEIIPALKAHKNGDLTILWFPISSFNYRESRVGHIMAATGAGAIPLDQLSPDEQKVALEKILREVRWHLGLPTVFTDTSRESVGGSGRETEQIGPRIPPGRIFEPQRPVDYIIITPLAEERDAVLSRLPGYRQLPPSTEDIRVYYAAEVPVTFSDGANAIFSVIVAPLAKMGHTEAASATGDAIRRWNPRYVLLVGIAGGVLRNGVGLGDVLIADQVADYELAKVTAEGSALRWRVQPVDQRLLIAAQNLRSHSWTDISTDRPKEGRPVVHCGPVCTGNKVIADGSMAAQFQDVWVKLIGVEMEAGGVANATLQSVTQPGFFMIRGVSDLADAEKDSKMVHLWRPYACEIAAAWAIDFLKSGPVPPQSFNRRPAESPR